MYSGILVLFEVEKEWHKFKASCFAIICSVIQSAPLQMHMESCMHEMCENEMCENKT